MVLTLLAILVAALLVLAALAGAVGRAAVTGAVAAICAATVVLAAVALGSGGGAAMALPIGPAGTATHLALDPLAASFLLLLFLVLPCTKAAPLGLAGVAVTLLAADSFAVAVGLLLLGGSRRLRASVVAAAGLVLAFALFGTAGDFATLRSAPPEGWRAACVLMLVLLGAGMLARTAPPIAAYLVLRALFDLCGTEQPLWWGLPLLLSGAAVAAAGSLRSAQADTLHEVVSNGLLLLLGMSMMAIGVALFARAVDLPSVASHALAAAWLALIAGVLGGALLSTTADVVERSAGTRRLDRLGGVIHPMPATAACCLIGLSALAVLPPGLGFAAFWLLFQSLLAAARILDPALRVLAVGATAVAAAAAGLALLSAVRLFGTAFLGRPRTPRAAVAEEAPPPARFVLAGLAALTGVLGLLPGLALLPASGWTHSAAWPALLVLRTGAEAPGYSPIGIAVLLAPALVIGLASRRGRQPRREPAWNGGFAAPPSWLPFGDPATQFGPASFSRPLHGLRIPALRVEAPDRLRRWCDAALRRAAAWMAP